MLVLFNKFNKFYPIKNFIHQNHKFCDAVSISKNNEPPKYTEFPESTDPEWTNAKPFAEMPGPSKWQFLFNTIAGGKLYTHTQMELHKKLYGLYGPLVRFDGVAGRRNYVLSFDPVSFEKLFRTEGVHPVRIALESFTHFRQKCRPDLYKDFVGITESQGETWAEARTLVNPVLLKLQNVVTYLQRIDEVATEFQQRILKTRDPKSLEAPADFENEVKRWALESIGRIALNRKLGLINGGPNTDKGEIILSSLKTFLQLVYELDVESLCLWKYYKTPKLKRMIHALDNITNVVYEIVQESKTKLKTTNDEYIMELFLKNARNEKIAMLLVMDLLLAGVDTTSAAIINNLLQLAMNPDKQDRLREEVMEMLPDKNSKLTEESLSRLPYLRACIKETHRIRPITIGTGRTTTQNIVLNGYQVPRGTHVIAVSQFVSNLEKYVPQPEKYIPERWLREDHEESCPELKMKNAFGFIPFGFGKRMCAGRRLAQLEIEAVLGRIIRNFRVEWHYPDVKYRINLINAPTGDLKFKFIDIEK